MPPRLLAAGAILASCAHIAFAQASAVPGRYTAHNDQGAVITLILQADGPGKVTGSFTGNGVTFLVEGQQQGEDVTGTMKNSTAAVYFEASREGTDLHLILVEPGADGRPDYTKGRELTLTADASGASAGVSSSAPATTQGSASARGNPLARSTAPGDPFSGTFTGSAVTLTLRASGATYVGTLGYQGQQFPASGTATRTSLTGKFTSEGTSFPFTLELAEGGSVNFSTGGTTYLLQRSGTAATRPANPLTSGAPASPGASAGSTALATTAQDRQIVQLLTSSAWCSFSYSGGTTNGGSYGVSHTKRAVFSADGTARQTSGGENTNSGAAGQVYGSSQAGETGFWRIQNGMLMLSQDRVTWQPQSMEITQNSNGYPIIKSGGNEYMMCR